MKLLGVDFGQARVGLAISDRALPRGAGTVARKEAVARIVVLVQKERIDAVVVGIPLAPDGGRGLRARQAANFAAEIETNCGVPVHLQDERDSSREATERLIEAGVGQKRRAERIDEMAAILILERFLADVPGARQSGKTGEAGRAADRQDYGGVGSADPCPEPAPHQEFSPENGMDSQL
ncbi:MAG: Holliday junction resolvase RuvX [Armatimonadetes bacterium]|nr:Holliday junction resolvase RuvX [Armatimonadota bacterium]